MPPTDPVSPPDTSNKLAMTKIKTVQAGSVKYYKWIPGSKDAVTTGTEAYQKDHGITFAAEPSISTALQMTETPTSRSALIIDNIMMVSKSREFFDKKTKKSNLVTSMASEHEINGSAAYMQGVDGVGRDAAKRGPLYRLDMKDPAQAGKMLHFEMIAHHQDAKTGFQGIAYYNAESKSMVVVYPGVDFGSSSDLGSLASTLRDEANPQVKFTEAFMNHVVDQVKQKHLDVQHSVITSHSLGAGAALSATAWCLSHPDKAKNHRRHLAKMRID